MYINESPTAEQMQKLREVAEEYNAEEHLDYDKPALILAWTLMQRYELILLRSLGSRWTCGRVTARLFSVRTYVTITTT